MIIKLVNCFNRNNYHKLVLFSWKEINFCNLSSWILLQLIDKNISVFFFLNQFLQNAFYLFCLNWLRYNFINLISPSFLYVLLLRMTRTSHDHRLKHIIMSDKLSNSIGCLIAIHDRHGCIHKNESIAISLIISLFYFIQCLLAIKCMVYNLIDSCIFSLH